MEIDRAGALLQCDNSEVVDLPLGLVKKGRGEIGLAVDGEPKTGCEVRNIRDLKLAAGGAKNSGQSRIRIDNAGHISEAAWLVAEVVDRVKAAGRVLDADRVVQKFAGDVVIDLTDGTTKLHAWLDPFLLAAIKRDGAAWGER